MLRGPLEHQRECAARKRSAKHTQVPQIDQCFMFRIKRVEMRGRVIFREHLNHHSIKNTNGRQMISFVSVFVHRRLAKSYTTGSVLPVQHTYAPFKALMFAIRRRFVLVALIAPLAMAARLSAQSILTVAGGGTDDGRPATAAQSRCGGAGSSRRWQATGL